MKRIIIALTLVFGSIGISTGQSAYNLPPVDAQTYALWQKKDWVTLISYGNEAIKRGIDFYYLRVRMGVAHYEQRNYHSAIHHFERAYKISQQELYLKEYLYYSYLFAGRKNDAKILASTFPANLKAKLGITEGGFIDQLSAYYSLNFMPYTSAIDNFPSSFNPPNEGIQEIVRSLNVLTIGLTHQVSPRFSLSHSYTNIQKKAFEFVRESTTSTTNSSFASSVHQYYIAGNSKFMGGFQLLYGGHYLNIRYPVETTYFRQGRTYTVTETVSISNGLGFVAAYKNLRYLTLGAAAYISRLNYSTQVQGDFSATYYPFGNLNLYCTSTLSAQTDGLGATNPRNALVFTPQVGFKVTRFLWIEGFANIGSLKNFIADNGSTVFNGTDIIDGRYGGKLILLPTPKLSVILSYAFTNAQSSFIEIQNIYNTYNPIYYTKNSLTGGIVWNF